MAHLLLVRGLPGSGKSTVAKSVAGYEHIETDQFFVDESGAYKFDPAMLATAHAWAQEKTLACLQAGRNVVVSNTFSMIWEMQPYLNMGYPVTVIECKGNYGSIHNVPAHAIDRMKQRWQAYSPDTTNSQAQKG